jgi:hypothetical protein
MMTCVYIQTHQFQYCITDYNNHILVLENSVISFFQNNVGTYDLWNTM